MSSFLSQSFTSSPSCFAFSSSSFPSSFFTSSPAAHLNRPIPHSISLLVFLLLSSSPPLPPPPPSRCWYNHAAGRCSVQRNCWLSSVYWSNTQVRTVAGQVYWSARTPQRAESVRYGTVCLPLVQCCVIWYDMVWYDMCDMCDAIWYNIMWYDIMWYDIMWRSECCYSPDWLCVYVELVYKCANMVEV